VITLAHLASVEAHHHGGVLADDRVRQDDGALTEGLVEFHREIARHLEVLFLVLAHRHLVGII